mmetsp:Transcript_39584/g.126344  ORF Transcript_39584/g.126344 Transcript_39584/m.126344 type:complete len:270 (-) Transcript_39584:252-1061(-)
MKGSGRMLSRLGSRNKTADSEMHEAPAVGNFKEHISGVLKPGGVRRILSTTQGPGTPRSGLIRTQSSFGGGLARSGSQNVEELLGGGGGRGKNSNLQRIGDSAMPLPFGVKGKVSRGGASFAIPAQPGTARAAAAASRSNPFAMSPERMADLAPGEPVTPATLAASPPSRARGRKASFRGGRRHSKGSDGGDSPPRATHGSRLSRQASREERGEGGSSPREDETMTSSNSSPTVPKPTASSYARSTSMAKQGTVERAIQDQMLLDESGR